VADERMKKGIGEVPLKPRFRTRAFEGVAPVAAPREFEDSPTVRGR